MTEQEKQELLKLTPDDLVELLDAERTARAKAEATFAADRKKIINTFLGAQNAPKTDEEEEDGEVFDLDKNKAFQRLKKRIN